MAGTELAAAANVQRRPQQVVLQLVAALGALVIVLVAAWLLLSRLNPPETATHPSLRASPGASAQASPQPSPEATTAGAPAPATRQAAGGGLPVTGYPPGEPPGDVEDETPRSSSQPMAPVQPTVVPVPLPVLPTPPLPIH